MIFKKTKIVFFLISIAILSYGVFFFFFKNRTTLNFSEPKTISLNDNGLTFGARTAASTVAGVLEEQNLSLSEYDLIIPEKETAIFPGTNILIQRALPIRITADGKTQDFFTLTNTVGDAIIDSRITLGEDDIVSPQKDSPLEKDLKISITRVEISEEIVKKPIDFKTISKEDEDLGWRIKKVEQKGIKGTKEIKYKVVRHDGKEISRKALEERVTEEPTPEIVIQGTYMKLGKAQRGDASFYASGWGELNASRTIPRGGYAKVTNMDNGKSVVIKINDYGPQSPQRIIDMSYASFSKIGDLGQGILPNVKVEQVLN